MQPMSVYLGGWGHLLLSGQQTQNGRSSPRRWLLPLPERLQWHRHGWGFHPPRPVARQ